MGMHLFEHNRTAYKNCVAMLDAVGKAAVIHPTGTGKSFIGFKLCEDNPEKTICWLSPSEYIFRTQLENLAETSDGYQPENIKFFTYAKLTLMTDDEISEIKPDYIILDEFHRCGAELWGMSVQKLLLSYKNAPVLGMSATAIRYLDNQRNMADELFDGNIASEMTLGEAIVRGILNAPKYVLSLFSYKETLEKYEIRVQKAQSKPVRDKAEKYLEKLRRALEKSEGLDKIFDKHMTDRTGKYIVFTANFESMQETIAKVLEWFHLVDEKPHIYSVYSDDSSANQSFIDFKADNDKQHLKLLFCIDALNEGIHVENISGVILLRPTVSPIIYKQQIGRALSASKSGVPVIFDIVNNIQNLYSIDSVREEMRDALHYFHEFERDDEIVNETFEIIDEVQDCLKLFHKLEETLTASWDIMFMEAEKYYREHGNLNLSGTYITENGYHLGLWVTVQRRNYHAHQYMSDARIRRLESIGMDWTPVEERIWNETYEICRKYYEQHHTLTGIKQYSKSAGNWLVTQRAKYNSGELKAERIEKLNQIGMIWDLDTVSEQYFQAAEKFCQENGHLDIPAKYVTPDGLNLGNWYRKIRGDYRKRILSEEKIQRLEKIGIQWESILTRKWMEYYRLAEQYFQEHGNLNVRNNYTAENGLKLGTWISSQRERYQEGALKDWQTALLEKIGMSWNRDESRWETGYRYALQYYQENGDINSIPEKYTVNGFKLKSWVVNQRNRFRQGKLSEERIARMEKIGLRWTILEEVWENNYQRAVEYYQKFGNLLVPVSYTCDDGFNLGVWINNLRTKYRTKKLSDVQIERLEKIGMVWIVNDVRWENMIAHMSAYIKEHGNLNFSQHYVCEDGYRLGMCLTTLRKNYRNGKLEEDKIRQLEELGFDWNPMQTLWMNGFRHAQNYFEEHGNSDYSARYVCEDGFGLGEWKRNQIKKIQANKISDEQREMLMQIGITS